MQRQTWNLFLGIFIGYALVHALKFLNSNLLWALFYH